MQIYVEPHWNTFNILPELFINKGKCNSAFCDKQNHVVIVMGLAFWSLVIMF